MAHADELYLFWYPYWYQNFTLNTQDTSEAEMLVSYWTNFAKTGDPTPPSAEVAWEPVTEGQHEYLEIDNEGLSMGASQYYMERVKFWEEIMGQRS